MVLVGNARQCASKMAVCDENMPNVSLTVDTRSKTLLTYLFLPDARIQFRLAQESHYCGRGVRSLRHGLESIPTHLLILQLPRCSSAWPKEAVTFEALISLMRHGFKTGSLVPTPRVQRVAV